MSDRQTSEGGSALPHKPSPKLASWTFGDLVVMRSLLMRSAAPLRPGAALLIGETELAKPVEGAALAAKGVDEAAICEMKKAWFIHLHTSHHARIGIPAKIEADDQLAAPTEPQVPIPAPLTVPSAGELIVALLCNRNIAEAVLGDLEEGFHHHAVRRGIRWARGWYWGQVACCAWSFAWRWGQRIILIGAAVRRIGF